MPGTNTRIIDPIDREMECLKCGLKWQGYDRCPRCLLGDLLADERGISEDLRKQLAEAADEIAGKNINAVQDTDVMCEKVRVLREIEENYDTKLTKIRNTLTRAGIPETEEYPSYPEKCGRAIQEPERVEMLAEQVKAWEWFAKAIAGGKDYRIGPGPDCWIVETPDIRECVGDTPTSAVLAAFKEEAS